MRLLMISGDRSILQGKRGAFWYTLEEMAKHWERIDVICPPAAVNEKKFPAAADDGSYHVFPNVYFHPNQRGLWHQPWWILQRGGELIATHHHTIMTVHEYPPFYNGIGARWLHRSTGIPFILEIHHVVGYPEPSSFTERVGYWLSRIYLPRAARRAMVVRCVSKGSAELLTQWDILNVEIVPSFYLDPESLKPDPGIPVTYDVVVCARLVKNKGMFEVIEALRLLPEKRLLVIGDGPLRPHLEKHAKRHGVHDQVTFTGWLEENSDVYYALQTSRVFVMNSRSEGGPRIALEAMALGMPVIATPVGVMPDVIKHGHNAFFTTGRPEDIAQKVDTLLRDDELRTNMGREARGIRDQFHRPSLIQAYAEFLKRFMQS